MKEYVIVSLVTGDQVAGPFSNLVEAESRLSAMRDGSYYAPQNGGVPTPNTMPMEIRPV